MVCSLEFLLDNNVISLTAEELYRMSENLYAPRFLSCQWLRPVTYACTKKKKKKNPLKCNVAMVSPKTHASLKCFLSDITTSTSTLKTNSDPLIAKVGGQTYDESGRKDSKFDQHTRKGSIDSFISELAQLSPFVVYQTLITPIFMLWLCH